MAINSTQSTTQLLAAQAANNRKAAEQAQLATPAQSNLSGGNPYSMMSSGINQFTNALNAPGARLAEQSNLDRVNAIRLQQQDYNRNRNAATDARLQQTTDANIQQQGYTRDRNAVTDARLQQIADANMQQQAFNQGLSAKQEGREAGVFEQAGVDRAAQIRAENAMAQLPMIEADIAREEYKAFKDKGLDPATGNFVAAEELARFDAVKAEKGDTFDAAAEFYQQLPESLAQDASAYESFTDDVSDGLKQAKKSIGSAWSKPYEQLAIQRALTGTSVGSGFLSIDGNFDEEGFRDRLKLEMANIIDAQGDLKNYKDIKRPFDIARKKAAAEALKAGVRPMK